MITFRPVVTGRNTIGIRVFFPANIQCLFGKVLRIMRLIQDWFPEEQRGMITMYTDHIPYIRINTLSKNRFFIPELPTRNFYQCKQT